jgi:hypothetical protein
MLNKGKCFVTLECACGDGKTNSMLEYSRVEKPKPRLARLERR